MLEPRWITRSGLVAAFVGAALLTPDLAQAGAYTLSPVRVDLSPSGQVAAVTVTNAGESALPIEVTAQRWEQGGGHDALAATRDLIVSPPLFTMSPHGSQIVRIGLRSVSPAAVERGYRLAFSELPTSGSQPGVHLLLRTSIPVFYAADSAAAAELRWAARVHGDSVLLDVDDVGSRHLEITHMQVSLGSTTLFDSDLLFYLLPGAQRQLTLPLGGRPLPPGAVLSVSARTDAAPPLDRLNVPVAVAAHE